MADRVRSCRVHALSRGLIGTSVPRREDRALVAGASQFAGDVRLPGLVHLAVVRSAHAHARLRKVDTSRAAAASGLIDVFSAAEIGPWLHPLASTRPFPPDVEPYRQRALARDTVRYVGEPLAAVVAETLGGAEDAAALVEVEVEELPVV